MTNNNYIREKEEISALIKKTVAFDFDGVIHQYFSPWTSDYDISDGPVPGIKQVIEQLRFDGYAVVVVSSRCRTQKGVDAISKWLKKNGIQVDHVMSTKPAAAVFVDDRAVCFRGETKNLVDEIEHFKPWI